MRRNKKTGSSPSQGMFGLMQTNMFALIWTSKTQQEIKTVPKHEDISLPDSRPRCKKCHWGIYSNSFARPRDLRATAVGHCLYPILHLSCCGFLDLPLLLLCVTLQCPPSNWALSPRILKNWLCSFSFFSPCILRGIKVFCCMFPFDQCHCSEVYTCKLPFLCSGELVQVSWQESVFAGSGCSSGSEWG